MRTIYSPDLKAHLTIDEGNRVRHILQTEEYFLSEKNTVRLAAADYLQKRAETFRIPLAQLERLHLKTNFLDPREQGIEYREYEIKKFFASTTFCYYQTIHNTPVWGAGMTVTVKEDPFRITHADHYGHDDLKVKLPGADVIKRARAALIQINTQAAMARAALTAGGTVEKLALKSLRTVVGRPSPRVAAGRTRAQAVGWIDQAKVTRGLFYIYRYSAEERVPKNTIDLLGKARNRADFESQDLQLTLPLSPVPGSVREGEHYLVAELIFHLPQKPRLNWKALIEVQTGAILWLRAMISGVINGMVFTYDPKTATGVLTNTPDSTNAVLNPLRTSVELVNLVNAAPGGVQQLTGTNVAVVDVETPAVAPPTQPVAADGSVPDFDYDARTNEFAAVSAYYHANSVFAVIESLGFNLAAYFDGTAFSVELDHRDRFSTTNGIEVNAFCAGDGPVTWQGDGIGWVGYCLSDDTGVADTTTNPLGRSVDKWVTWHELGGHGILYDHVSSPNFGFCHSAGDPLAAFQNDPESRLRSLPERFQYAPFRSWPAKSDRWFDRAMSEGSVASVNVTNGGTGYASPPLVSITGGGGTGATAHVEPSGIVGSAVTAVIIDKVGRGYTSAPSVVFSGGGGSGATATASIATGTWGWGGNKDDGQYGTEQILATTLFRLYRALGGDSNDVAKRWQASRVATYLVLNAVGKCSPTDNPGTAEAFYNKLKDADDDDWTSEGWAGGAYNKVIRWAFEKQGLWRAPGAPVTDIGAPPAVDLYVDDGRGGEYQYQAVHWENPSVWNRAAADGTAGGTTQQPGVAGVKSYAYVKIKNRGTTNASGTVKVYHCNPGAGLTWPTDFVQAGPAAGSSTGTVLANNGNEVIVGPFEWTPNVNAYGHDCLLAIVTTGADTSNVDKLGPGETIQEWRLVPHDNNVGQRNVQLVPGGGGGEALVAGLDGVVFFAGNNFNRPADMELRVDVPRVLAAKGWRLQFAGVPGNQFRLKAGEKREITLRLVKGADFTADDIRTAADRNLTVYLHGSGTLLGGMTYAVDPDMKEPVRPGGPKEPCKDIAQDLVDCFKVSGGRKVKKVCVKKIAVDIELDNDCDC